MAVHVDIVLDDGTGIIPAGRIPDLTDSELAELDGLLRPAVAKILTVFEPREEK